jgi:uncharacterized protein YgbK (DUF1537 family)
VRLIDEDALLTRYPAGRHVDPSTVAQSFSRAGLVLVVLDDDPTGTQSIANLPVLTAWDRSDFAWAFSRGAPAVYVLTNTRSLDEGAAATRIRKVVESATAASVEAGIRISFVSRSDSTLRGHFPLETDTIANVMVSSTGRGVDAIILVPAFPDAGRVTIGSVHYVRGPEELVPVGETEFAADATFGYRNSDLREWVEEKSDGRWAAADVVSLDLGTLRSGTAAIAAALAPLGNSAPVVVDAVTEDDLRALSLGIAAAEADGKVVLCRVGPPFVRARIGQVPSSPLGASDVYRAQRGERKESLATGGLIVVGSHVALTSRQLNALRAAHPLSADIELDSGAALDPTGAPSYLANLATEVGTALAEGDVVLHTSRALATGNDPQESLAISARVSSALVLAVRAVVDERKPRFVIAKGGITSSDVATGALGIRRAIVRGSLLPGMVSVWEPADGSAAGIPYVVFAGNVGADNSLAEVVATLSAHGRGKADATPHATPDGLG